MQTIEEQKEAAERELAEANQALVEAQAAFDQDRSDASAELVLKCQGKRELLSERATRLSGEAAKQRSEADRREAQAELDQLNARLTEGALAKALEPLVEREKIARIELMNVLMELDRVSADLRETCFEAERIEDALNPAAAAVAPAVNTRANARSHRVATSVSVAWARLVNAALEQAVGLPASVPLRDPRRNALRAVQI